jgi:hypothetical protein
MTDTEIYGCDYSSTGFITSNGDMGCVSELDNAEQAIKNRLLTRLGTYPNIDSEYGSEIHLVQGEKRNDKHINELEIYIQNCMLEEPRVYEVTDLNITEVEHDALRIDLLLLLVDGSELGFTEEINTYG